MGNESKSGKIAMSLLILLMGLGIGGYTYQQHLEQKEKINSYEPTDATIISSEVERQSTQDGVSFSPEIEYEYTVDGETYQSDTVAAASGPGGQLEVEELVENHQAGTTATAYYDPADPSQSYLIEGSTSAPLLAMGIGGVFVLFGLVGVVGNLFGD